MLAENPRSLRLQPIDPEPITEGAKQRAILRIRRCMTWIAERLVLKEHRR